MEEKIEKLKTIYEQDSESFRYQDKLYWSRFQTSSVVEGAALWALLFGNITSFYMRLFIAIGNLILIGLIYIVALKDYNDASNYLKRMTEYERLVNASPIYPKKVLGIFNGKYTMWVIFILITALNGFMIYYAVTTKVNGLTR